MPEPTQPTVADPTATTQPPAEPTPGATPETWEAWLEAQDDTIKGLVSKRFEALENTVKATRDERQALSDQLKDLKKKKGDDLQAAIDDMSAKLEVTERRAAFMESAIRPEVQCRNPRAAWLLAVAENLFDKKGGPDWTAIKAAAPEIFGAPIANANPGNGTRNPPPKQNDMNAFIRRKAGRA